MGDEKGYWQENNWPEVVALISQIQVIAGGQEVGQKRQSKNGPRHHMDITQHPRFHDLTGEGMWADWGC